MSARFFIREYKRNFKLDWKNVALSLNEEAFVDLRVNMLKNKTRDDILNSLKKLMYHAKLVNILR